MHANAFRYQLGTYFRLHLSRLVGDVKRQNHIHSLINLSPFPLFLSYHAAPRSQLTSGIGDPGDHLVVN